MAAVGLLRTIALFAALAFAHKSDVRADEPPKPPPVRRIKVLVREDVAEPAPSHGAGSPLRAIARWALRRVMGEAEAARAAVGNPLRTWFAGGAHVPLADLRDALVADG